VVKGFLVEHMEFEVDWANAAVSTTVLLASQLEGEILKQDLASNESAQYMQIAPYATVKQPSP
jgi:hypothetical protein